MKAKLTDPSFPRNLGTLYQGEVMGRKIGTLDKKFGNQVLRHSKTNFIPVWTNQTMESAGIQHTATAAGKTRWICTSINWQNDDLYDSKGRYGYTPAVRGSKKPFKPENVNKHEWFDRSYAFKRKQRHKEIRQGVYDA